MNQHIENIKKFRRFLLEHTEHLTSEQLNTIPPGYNNNIIWNMAHLISAQQAIAYRLAGQATIMEDHFVTAYLPGTKPQGILGDAEIEFIKEKLVTTIDQFATDYDNHLFEKFSPSERIKKIYNIELNTINDALSFILFHEGFHVGYVLSLKHGI